MRTIATDGRSMAGDGLSTMKGTIVASDSTKVFRLPDGRLFGACGNNEDSLRARRWLVAGGDKPKLAEEFGAIVLESDGRVISYADELLPEPVMGPMAMGSGMDFAIGAMLAGASPAEAVGIASGRDPHTGGSITELTLEVGNG